MKVKMKSMVEKPKKSKMSGSPMMPKEHYQSMEFHSGQMDNLDGLKLGDRAHILLDGEVESTRNPDEYEKDRKKGPIVRFKIHKGGIQPKKDKKLDKDYDKQVDMGEQE